MYLRALFNEKKCIGWATLVVMIFLINELICLFVLKQRNCIHLIQSKLVYYYIIYFLP